MVRFSLLEPITVVLAGRLFITVVHTLSSAATKAFQVCQYDMDTYFQGNVQFSFLDAAVLSVFCSALASEALVALRSHYLLRQHVGLFRCLKYVYM